MDVSELDNARFTEQLTLRRELIAKLLDDGFSLYDMNFDGANRYQNGKGEFKTLRWNSRTVTYEIL